MDIKFYLNLFKHSKSIFIFIMGLLCLIPAITTACDSTDINDSPMETAMAAAPANVMFVFDDSGSMDWEFMTPEEDGLVHESPPSSGGRYYLFPAGDYSPYTDHNYYDSYTIDESQRRRWKYQWAEYNKLYYDPRQVYVPWPGAAYGDANTTQPRSNPVEEDVTFNLAGVFLDMNGSDDDFSDNWQTATQVECGDIPAEINRSGNDNDYFKIVLETSGTLTVRTYDTGDCTDTLGRILDSSGNPYRIGDYPDLENRWWTDNEYYDDDCGSAAFCDHTCRSNDYNFYISLDNVPAGTYYIDVIEYGKNNSGSYILSIDFTGTCATPPPSPPPTGPVAIYNAHYFAWDDADGDDVVDNLEVYLVNFEDSDGDGILDVRKYYKFDDENGNDIVDSSSELELVSYADVPDSIKAVKRDENGNITGYMTFGEELQNFANWFSYYRRRELTAKAAISMAIDQLQNVNSGLYTIHERVKQPVLYLDSANRSALLSELFSIYSSGGTPLRYALMNVGRYFDADDGYTGGIGSAPWASEADGGGCQQAFSIVMTDGYWNGYDPGVGNVDGDDGTPFADSYSDTLADVARYYYENDLSDALPNEVPVNDCDSNHKQHMVTYGLSFGVKGELSPSYDAYHECMLDVINGAPGAPPAPAWENPDSCYACGKKIDDLWHAAVNGRGTFVSAGNPRELIDALGNIVSNISGRAASGAAVSINSEKLTTNTILFQATYESGSWTGDLMAFSLDALTGDVSDSAIWNSKTALLDQDWDTGRRIITSDGSSAMPFRYNSLTGSQKSYISNNADVVKFIRGDQISGMRNRPLVDGKVDKLGDLVHSAPTLVNNTIFVGGNDGMLHAFDANSGEERFAFVPYSVYPKLARLTDPSYVHTFYVDLTPTARLNTPQGNILVGGLGAGGKGYFALNITNADSITSSSAESSVQSMFLWEYPGQNSDPDLGVSMSKVSIVRSHSAVHPWVAIFGNGYNSTNGSAVLYVLDLFTGNVVKKIDTGVGNCNGLSTPAVVDVDGDFVADYVYAGDLQGNMWKFDITGESESQWASAYGTHPLFTAEGQAITTKPDIMRHCARHGFMVIFGTGKYFGLSDASSSSQETVYGIWDYGDAEDEYVGSFNAETKTFTPSDYLSNNNVELLEQVITDEGDFRITSDNSANWSVSTDPDADSMPDPKGTSTYKATVGWYANFITPGERLSRDIVIRNGFAIVITVIPNASPCSGGGSSVLYEFEACDGGAPGSPVFDVDEDATLDEKDKVGGDYPTGKEFTTIVHDPVFLRLPGKDQEFKYFSTAQGTIERIREPADFLGIYYWIEW